jgi:hypothetical protein
MTHAAAAKSATAFGFRYFTELMRLIRLGGKVAVKASGMTSIANSLFILGLLVAERDIEILADPFCISVIETGGNQDFRRGKIGK